MAGQGNYFHIDEASASVPETGGAIVDNWWVTDAQGRLACWFDPARAGLAAEARPICNASEAAARRVLGGLGLPAAGLRRVPVVFMAHADREARRILEAYREEGERLKAERAERDAAMPEVGTDAWKAFVADAAGVAPRTRKRGQIDALAVAHEIWDRHRDGDGDGVAAETAMEGRLGLMPDGRVRCLLTPRDWQMYHATKDCRPAAAALNAAVERAFRDGHDLADALAPVMEAHARYGADDTEPRAVLAGVSEVLEGWKASPACTA